jgi:hypothetical protein
MTEVWVIEIVENPAKNRKEVIKELVDFFNDRDIPAFVRAVFTVEVDGLPHLKLEGKT